MLQNPRFASPDPGAALRPTHEAGLVASGRMDLGIGDTLHHLNAAGGFDLRGTRFRRVSRHCARAVVFRAIASSVSC